MTLNRTVINQIGTFAVGLALGVIAGSAMVAYKVKTHEPAIPAETYVEWHEPIQVNLPVGRAVATLWRLNVFVPTSKPSERELRFMACGEIQGLMGVPTGSEVADSERHDYKILLGSDGVLVGTVANLP